MEMLHATDSDSVSNSSQNSVDEIYVKSILENLEALKMQFLPFLEPLNFLISESLKLQKLQYLKFFKLQN